MSREEPEETPDRLDYYLDRNNIYIGILTATGEVAGAQYTVDGYACGKSWDLREAALEVSDPHRSSSMTHPPERQDCTRQETSATIAAGVTLVGFQLRIRRIFEPVSSSPGFRYARRAERVYLGALGLCRLGVHLVSDLFGLPLED